MVQDSRKRDLSPTVLDFGPVIFSVARSFGFCYGVENAVEIAYQTLQKHPNRRKFMLSEMIHNPFVNNDLQRQGMRFLRSTTGEQLIPMDTLIPEDIVLIPAFGTSLEIKRDLVQRGLDIKQYDTTCPFVSKVWRRSKQIGLKGYTVVVHGKRYHEESRATFSHAKENSPVVVLRDLNEAKDLARVIKGEEGPEFFFERFDDRYSTNFNPEKDLERIGVVNQTTMLVTETKIISGVIRQALIDRYGEEDISYHFADTADTLCYATYENQEATVALLKRPLDVALVVGGYNSSNTSQLVSICKEVVPTFFIKDSDEIQSETLIHHFDYPTQKHCKTINWLPQKRPVRVALTAGASCPDALLDKVIDRVVSMMQGARTHDEVLEDFHEQIGV